MRPTVKILMGWYVAGTITETNLDMAVSKGLIIAEEKATIMAG